MPAIGTLKEKAHVGTLDIAACYAPGTLHRQPLYSASGLEVGTKFPNKQVQHHGGGDAQTHALFPKATAQTDSREKLVA